MSKAILYIWLQNTSGTWYDSKYVMPPLGHEMIGLYAHYNTSGTWNYRTLHTLSPVGHAVTELHSLSHQWDLKWLDSTTSHFRSHLITTCPSSFWCGWIDVINFFYCGLPTSDCVWENTKLKPNISSFGLVVQQKNNTTNHKMFNSHHSF